MRSMRTARASGRKTRSTAAGSCSSTRSSGRMVGPASAHLRMKRGRRPSPSQSQAPLLLRLLYACEQLPLYFEFREQALINVPVAIGNDRRAHAGLRMACIIPAEVCGNGIPANPADISDATHGISQLVANIIEP